MVINSVMPSVDVSEQYQRDPLGAFLEATRHGDVVQIVLPAQMILLNHPNDVATVLLGGDCFPKPSPSGRTLTIFGKGLVTSEGEEWKQQRKAIQPAFHANYLRTYSTIMVEATNELLRRWNVAAQAGETLDIAEEMRQLTLSVVSAALFGAEHESWLVQALTALIHPATPEGVFQSTLHRVESVAYRLIKERQRQTESRQDVLSLLIQAGMSKQQIRDELLTFWVAGYDTTAAALAWLWYLLSQHPAVEQRLEEEVRTVLGDQTPTVEHLKKLPYLLSVVDETLRLYPPVWATNRVAFSETFLGGYRIPAGAMLLLSPYTTHRHPAFWPNPEAFDPERFSPERSGGRPRFSYLPFGGGPRQCIGNHFALYEANLILMMVAQRYKLRLTPGYVAQPEPLLSLRIRGGLPMTLESIA